MSLAWVAQWDRCAVDGEVSRVRQLLPTSQSKQSPVSAREPGRSILRLKNLKAY